MRSQDFVHVSMKNDESDFSCANGTNCTRVRVTVSKKKKTLSLCPHEHIARMLSGKTSAPASAESGEDDDDDEKDLSDEKEWLENSAKYVFDNYRVDFSDSNMRRLEEKVMEKNKSGDWSRLYQVC